MNRIIPIIELKAGDVYMLMSSTSSFITKKLFVCKKYEPYIFSKWCSVINVMYEKKDGLLYWSSLNIQRNILRCAGFALSQFFSILSCS